MALTLIGLVIFRGSESLKRQTSLLTLPELYSGCIICSYDLYCVSSSPNLSLVPATISPSSPSPAQQWPALSTQFSFIMEPPQEWLPSDPADLLQETCHGYSPSSAS